MTYIIILWYFVINFVMFSIMGIDKYKAKHNKWRIPEITLITLAYLGGFLGAYMGMYLFHHKTKKWYFHFNFAIATIIHTAIFILYIKQTIG